MNGPRIIVTGTDTGVGKTVFAAGLTGALGASYWKPIQAGRDPDGGTDALRVAALARLSPDRVLPEAYCLDTPCSPRLAAEIDGVTIEPERLVIPGRTGALVIEGAGGVHCPVTRTVTYADVFARWQAPVVLVARTALGTINHSLLSLEALRARRIPVIGIAFVGDANEDSEATICAMGGARRLGRLPHLPALNPEALAQAFAAGFRLSDFAP